MTKRTFATIAVAMVAVATAVRINNALTFPSLRGYDGFGHFTYIWYMAETWRVPLATAGWSFFHPPLYYAVMAVLWKALAGVDPLVRLSIGAVVMGILSLAHAAVSYLIVRRYFPGERWIHLLAPGLMLFLPVHIYSAPFLGNEGLGAVLSSVSLLALLYTLRRPSLPHSALLGLCLGLAMLAKFSGLAVTLGAFGTLALQPVVRRNLRAAARTLAVVAVVMLAVCGWYYARNIMVYGEPFKLSRDEFMVRHVEHIQTKGERGFLEYVLFDPVVFRRPQWPRGLPLSGDLPPFAVRSPLREAVWTGMYANTWFDGFGGWVLPTVTDSELARRAGQALLTLGLVPTLLVALGILTAIRTLWREGWNDTLAAMLLTFVVMVVIFIHGTRVAPLHAAIKATYFMPITVIFSFWFALGLKRLAELRPRWVRAVTAELALLGVLSALVFTHGLLFPRVDAFKEDDSIAHAVWDNLNGIVYYAGGDRATAKKLFESSASHSWHLGYENLASLVYGEGRPLEALYLLKTAARLEYRQSFGILSDRMHFDMITQAEYLNSMAVLYDALGWPEEALRAALEAATRDTTMAEAHYNAGALMLVDLTRHGLDERPTDPHTRVRLEQARTELGRAVSLDPGFAPASALLGVTQALLGDCAEATRLIEYALSPASGLRREFPVETGRGINHSASIGRRKHIEHLPEMLEPEHQLAVCRSTHA